MINGLRGEFNPTLLKNRVIKAVINETDGEFRKAAEREGGPCGSSRSQPTSSA